ncbi:glucoamylase family protein [Emticicia agri]|uniref:Beta-glucosidase n=1 Tax=Emticicia agri TaxID=2492393 RepID=A0A4Q5LYS8_9BACT|nr:glucoamylase family protein [Emticicia agri]RYU95096.1 beta-glucosidase [Emticicia agri]
MKILHLGVTLIIVLFSCKTQDIVEPEQFFFRTVAVNGSQPAGFNVNNLNLLPKVDISFSAPLNKESAQTNITLQEKNSSVKVPLNLSFSNLDSSVSISPQQPLKSITQYDLTVNPELVSKNKTLLNTTIKVGMTTQVDTTDKFPRISDDELLTLVQRQTFKYFWDFGHPVSGLARERNTSGDIVTSGGSGFGVMTIPVAIERGFITRKEGLDRMLKITGFLKNTAKSYHGVFPHWLNGATGATVPFSANDNGADLVETAYLIQGLLTVRQYFTLGNVEETRLRKEINELWEAVEWDWFTKGGEKVLYWHWSPTVEWKMNHQIRGWNECLITYFLAAASPTHPISKEVYDNGWADNGKMKNGRTYYGTVLPLGFDYGGPLFFSHYSFLGLDPRNLKDKYANYWEQNVAHTKVNYGYCVANPKKFNGYGPNCWGLTASDTNTGYAAHSPTEDLGVISPTAALSAMPYTPNESMAALRFFYYKLGDKIWKNYGFADAFNLTNIWIADSFLAIDQGPIICMIENHRTGLLWNLFMSSPEAKNGKTKLGFE